MDDQFRDGTKKTDDLIRRQDAISLVEKHYRAHDNDLLELIAYEVGRLPSAQLGIIRCKDCKYSQGDVFDRDLFCKHGAIWFDVNDNHYCSLGERRNDG